MCRSHVTWQSMHFFFNTEWILFYAAEDIFHLMVIEDLISCQNEQIVALLLAKMCSCLGCIVQYQCLTCDTTSDEQFWLIHVYELS
jgi:hypothetical protein